MELRDYMFKNRLTEKQMAGMLGITRGHLSCIKRKATQPSKLLAREIERLTEYNVLTEDLRPNDKGPELKPCVGNA